MNKENWLTAPINKKSFQNIESLFDTIRLKRSSGAPSEKLHPAVTNILSLSISF